MNVEPLSTAEAPARLTEPPLESTLLAVGCAEITKAHEAPTSRLVPHVELPSTENSPDGLNVGVREGIATFPVFVTVSVWLAEEPATTVPKFTVVLSNDATGKGLSTANFWMGLWYS